MMSAVRREQAITLPFLIRFCERNSDQAVCEIGIRMYPSRCQADEETHVISPDRTAAFAHCLRSGQTRRVQAQGTIWYAFSYLAPPSTGNARIYANSSLAHRVHEDVSSCQAYLHIAITEQKPL